MKTIRCTVPSTHQCDVNLHISIYETLYKHKLHASIESFVLKFHPDFDWISIFNSNED